MRYLYKIALIFIFALGFSESKAETLFDSLNIAYFCPLNSLSLAAVFHLGHSFYRINELNRLI